MAIFVEGFELKPCPNLEYVGAKRWGYIKNARLENQQLVLPRTIAWKLEMFIQESNFIVFCEKDNGEVFVAHFWDSNVQFGVTKDITWT